MPYDDLQVHGAEWVLTMDADARAYRDGLIAVRSGRIEWVGCRAHADDDVLAAAPGRDRRRTVLMPGFVNGHSHAPMSILRGVGSGAADLEDWLENHIWPAENDMSADDVLAGTAMACEEMASGGITASAELYWLHPEMIMSVFGEFGMRLCIAPDVCIGEGDIEDRLHEVYKIAADFHDNPLVEVMIGAHSLYTAGLRDFSKIAKFARAAKIGIHTHLSETQAGPPRSVSDTQTLHEVLGAFEVPVLGAHGIHLSDSDMDILAEAGVGVVHCPASNLSMGQGTADARAMLDAGVNVGLGTDGAVSAPNLDMFEAMRAAVMASNHEHRSTSSLSPYEVLQMATSGSAGAAGLNCGSLEAGKWADFVLLDMGGENASRHCVSYDSAHDLYEDIVMRGSKADISEVRVGGMSIYSKRSGVGSFPREHGVRLSVSA